MTDLTDTEAADMTNLIGDLRNMLKGQPSHERLFICTTLLATELAANATSSKHLAEGCSIACQGMTRMAALLYRERRLGERRHG